MVRREYWLRRIEALWQRRSVVWLHGVRRAGKTVLCQTLDAVDYHDCELPRVRSQMADPEAFLKAVAGRRIALDEIHRLPDPTELLKIAADHFPSTRVLATGSSTLEASARFRDALTGRKAELRLTPMILEDQAHFGRVDVGHRLLHGGLPPFFLADRVPEADYQEWVDSFWARDIQELFRLERRHSFQRFLELLFVDSGGIFEASRFAAPCEISRSSVSNYLAVLEATGAVTIVRPYATRPSTEIVSAPKVYAFDTGFVCFFRGWTSLRPEDKGVLWEHLVLNEMVARLQVGDIRYWRDKRGHEVDYVLIQRGRPPVAIECKWSQAGVNLRNLHAFRRAYPEGENWLVAADVEMELDHRDEDLVWRQMGLSHLATALEGRAIG